MIFDLSITSYLKINMKSIQSTFSAFHGIQLLMQFYSVFASLFPQNTLTIIWILNCPPQSFSYDH